MSIQPTERPILFSGRPVSAILEGRMTETRRIAKLTDAGHVKEPRGNRRWHPDDPNAVAACPFGGPGDRLWVRETWCGGQHGTSFLYRADWPEHDYGPRWRPSIHMPRRASRLTLEVVSRRLERLQEITEDGARAEGVHVASRAADPDGSTLCVHCGLHRNQHLGVCRVCPESHGEVYSRLTYRGGFAWLWDEMNGKRAPWDSNPLVWVVSFRLVANGEAAGVKS